MSRNPIRGVVVFLALAIGVGACAHSKNKSIESPLSMTKDRLIRFEFAPGELTQLCTASIQTVKTQLDEIAAVPVQGRTFDNTMLAFERAVAEFNDVSGPLTFMGYVSTDKGIHDEGQKCEEIISPFLVEIYSRRDLYNAIKDAQPRNAEEKRLLSETLRDFEKAGMKLSEEKLAEMKKLMQELSVLSSQFQSNLNNDATSIEFSEAELDGVSADFKARLKKSANGKLIVTTKSPDYMHMRENAKNPDTRRKMMLTYFNKAADKNVALLEQGLVLRQKIAALMGFKTWADYQIWGRMAKDGTTVLNFLNGLKGKLRTRLNKDMVKLLAYKKKIDPSATKLDAWDLDYMAYQIKKRDYSLDNELIKEFFPSDRVISSVLEIYSKLLGIRFEEVKDVPVWASGVKLFRIVDTSDNTVRAHVYMDLFPREGKYGHFAAFSLVMTHKKNDGAFQKPVSAIVGNFNPPTADKPSLMDHNEVETFFHEFGHIMHQTLTRAPYASLSGTATARDFVEAPSQIMENWAWSPKILTMLSGHYKDPKKPLPKDLIKKMIEAKNFNQGNFYTRQLMLGLLDMTYHTSSGAVDTTAVYDNLYKEIVGIEPLKGGHFQAGFGHLMNGYDAGYYGYIWSEVYADDLFTRFGKQGFAFLTKDHLLDPKVGMSYRTNILEKGRMEDADMLMRKFLGREPSSEAFFKRLGIK